MWAATVSVFSPQFFPSWAPRGTQPQFPLLPHRATQEELQRGPAPSDETPPLQRRPSVRAVISPAESAAARERPQTEPIPEEEAARRPGRAETPRSAEPASPDLGPRGPELASLQAERDVVSGEEPDVRGRDGRGWGRGQTSGSGTPDARMGGAEPGWVGGRL